MPNQKLSVFGPRQKQPKTSATSEDWEKYKSLYSYPKAAKQGCGEYHIFYR